MNDKFVNRMGMFKTALDTLNSAQHTATWFNKDPKIFTVKVAQAVQAVDDLGKFCRQQGINLTGVTQDKKREEHEAVEATYTLAGLLIEWFKDAKDLTNAAQVDFTRRDLYNERDETALGKMRNVRDLAQAILDDDDPQTVTAAAEYGITALVVQAADKEIEEFAVVLNAPSSSISQRAALTIQLRARFNEVEAKFVSLDNLILGFNNTPEGRALIAAYEASRIVRDLGSGSATAPQTPPVTP